MKNMGISQIVTIDPEILSGQPVFSGTRVPIDSFFDHLEAGVSLDEYLFDIDKIIATGPEAFEAKVGFRSSGDL